VALTPKRPADSLAGAKSVIVIGIGLLDASIDEVGKPPGRKAGHYHAATHEEIFNQLSTVLWKCARALDAGGHACAPSMDLCGLASTVRGGGVDLTANRFAAIAAGLGEIGLNGIVVTPRFGARQRFACLITDAEVEYDDVYDGPVLCDSCLECVKACPVAAISEVETQSVELCGRTFTWGRLDRLRCDFVKRYGLIPESGGEYVGCRDDFQLPDTITPEYICGCMHNADRIQRPSCTPTVERCFTRCTSHRQ
jgi:epoxyqueuosine reductase QueG